MMKKMIPGNIKSFFAGQPHNYRLDISKIILYLLLIAIGFVYLYPLLFMFVTSMKVPATCWTYGAVGSHRYTIM